MADQALIKNEQQAIIRFGKPVRYKKHKIPLQEKQGHIYLHKGQPTLSYEGYKYLEKFTNIIIKPAEYVISYGKKQPNPFEIREEKVLEFAGRKTTTNFINEVFVRMIGVGRAPTGSISVVDLSLYYNVTAYFMRNLLNLVRNEPSVAEIRNMDSITKEELKHPHHEFYPISEGNVIMILNNMHDEYIAKLNQYYEDQKHASRKAQSMCRRNILKNHPALGITRVERRGTQNNHVAVVEIPTWLEHDLTEKELTRMADAYAHDENYKPDEEEIEYQEVEVGEEEWEEDAPLETMTSEETDFTASDDSPDDETPVESETEQKSAPAQTEEVSSDEKLRAEISRLLQELKALDKKIYLQAAAYWNGIRERDQSITSLEKMKTQVEDRITEAQKQQETSDEEEQEYEDPETGEKSPFKPLPNQGEKL